MPKPSLITSILRQTRRLSGGVSLNAVTSIPGLVGYWKADPEYLFEDSAGTTPASTSGTGPVGSWYGVNAPTYGPNLVSNGTFDTDTTGWTAYTGSIAQENGELKLINGASAPYAYTYTPITTEAGATYVVTATCHSESVNNMVSIFAGITTNGTTLGSDPGDYTVSGQALETLSFAFIASGTTTYIGAGNRGLANAIGYLDNITVKKVLSGAKAIQATTANKPILRKTPTTGVYWADANTSTSALNVALSDTVLGRRNLLQYSEQLEAGWTKTRVSIGVDSTTTWDGVQIADKVIEDTSSAANHYLTINSLVVGATTTINLEVKSAERSVIEIKAGSSTTTALWFDATNNTFSTIGGAITAYSSSALGSGWYRIKFTCVPPSSTALTISLINGSGNYTGDGTSGIYITRIQAELGSVATDYQKITNVPAYCTLARATAEGVTFTDNTEIAATYNIAPAFSFNADVAIFNRALTATEKALITRYMQRAVPMLGSNLVTNGTFDTDTGWTKGSGVSISGGGLQLSATNADIGATQIYPLSKAGVQLYSKLTIDNFTSGTIRFYAFSSGPVSYAALGSFSSVHIGHAATYKDRIYILAGVSNTTATIDNASVREIL